MVKTVELEPGQAVVVRAVQTSSELTAPLDTHNFLSRVRDFVRKNAEGIINLQGGNEDDKICFLLDTRSHLVPLIHDSRKLRLPQEKFVAEVAKVFRERSMTPENARDAAVAFFNFMADVAENLPRPLN